MAFGKMVRLLTHYRIDYHVCPLASLFLTRKKHIHNLIQQRVHFNPVKVPEALLLRVEA